MRKVLLTLAIFTVGSAPALAQTGFFDLPPVQSKFVEMNVSWETKIVEFPNSDLGEARFIKVGLVFDPIVEGPSFGDDIYVRFEGASIAGAIGPPCITFFIPGSSIDILPNKSFRIASTDPKLNRVKNLLTDSKGQIIQDVTGDMTFFDLRLAPRNGEWRLDIELEKRAPTLKPDWVLPGGSIGTSVVIGNSNSFFGYSGGLATPEKVEMVHVMK